MQNMNAESTKTHYNTFAEVGNDARKKAYLNKNILPLIGKKPAENPKFLEIGPGCGELLELLLANGFQDLNALEVCEKYAQDLIRKGFSVQLCQSVIEACKEIPDSTIDTVFLIDILEHIPMNEVLELLAQIWRLLKPGGEIVIQVPNISGLYGWNTFAADPTHITPFNETRLKCCLKVAGFKDSECKELALPGGLGDLVRTILHKPIFLMHRFMMRCVGANPVKILTHNVIAIGRKS